jgi:integrase
MAIRHTVINGSQKVWLARVAYQGRRRAKVCRTKEEARHVEGELLRDLKAEAAKEEQEGARPATLKSLFEFYVADLEARGKGPDTIGRAIETAHVVELLTPDVLDKPVTRIGEADVFAFRRARVERSATALRFLAEAKALRADGKATRAETREKAAQEAQRAGTKPSTINRDLRTLRAALKRARPDFRFPAGAFLPEDETRVRWLRPEEELLVLETMRSPFREIAKLAALTLMRLSEIRTLRRQDVHLEQGVVMLPKAKAGARPVILSGEAQKILRGQLEAVDQAHAEATRKAEEKGIAPPRASEYVFPGPDGLPYERSYVGRVFRRAARAAGLRDFHFHDLRHHGATMALNRGFTAPIVMALGGWKTERMMRRYAAVTDQTLRAAAEAVSGAEPLGWVSSPAPALRP